VLLQAKLCESDGMKGYQNQTFATMKFD